MRLRWLSIVLALVAGSAGCAKYSAVGPQRVSIGQVYTVEPQIRWSALPEGNSEYWTVDGLALETVRFVKGLSDSEPLSRLKDPGKAPKFRKTMTPNEIVDLVVDSFVALGATQVEVRSLRPAKFGSADGFRFDLTYLQRGGLEGQGLVAGTVFKDKLYLILYLGARAHYFPRYHDHVERMIQSVILQ